MTEMVAHRGKEGEMVAHRGKEGEMVLVAAPADPSPTDHPRPHDDMTLERQRWMVEKRRLTDQLALQIKVNDELRGIMVSTMSDDLHEHVRSLGEDRAVLATNIDTLHVKNVQQTTMLDDVNIEADVWRAKYMATSVLTDELVGWRVFLVRRLAHTQTLLAQLYGERLAGRDAMLVALRTIRRTLRDLQPWTESTNEQSMSSERLGAELQHESRRLLTAVERRRGKTEEENVPTAVDGVLDQQVKETLSLDTRTFLSTTGTSPDYVDSGERQARLLGKYNNCKYKNLTFDCCPVCRGREIYIV